MQLYKNSYSNNNSGRARVHNVTKPALCMLTCALLLSACTFPFRSTTQSESKPETAVEPAVHLHAGFKVFIDNKLQNYSDFAFMSFSTCSVAEDAPPKTPEEEQIERAHLHDNIGDVVHVHRAGATWKDLFVNSNIELPENATISAYRADTLIPDILDQQIRANESIVFILGDQSQTENLRKESVTLAHIQEIESKSELCNTSPH